MSTPPAAANFSTYQRTVIAIIAFIQFTVVVDFIILSPLGAVLLDELSINPSQFGLVVSAYAFSAGISGVLTAGFADKFDRKRMLLVFYVGFIVGTALCGIAPSYPWLLAARIVTGLFGGVIGGIGMAIAADLFPLQVRGRVMGLVQTSFAAANVLGIPVGLLLSNAYGWHAPFIAIAAVGAVAGVAMALLLKPVDAHLKDPARKTGGAFAHLWGALKKPAHLRGFSATVLLATGGFMLGPFSTAFMVNNLHIPMVDLPTLYVCTGVFAIAAGPLIGRIADRFGKYRTFVVGSVFAMVIVVVYSRLDGPTSFWLVTAVSILMFCAITARVVPASALTSAVPAAPDRGAYMAINGSIQQMSGGFAAAIGGMIIVQNVDGTLGNFDVLGLVVAAAALITLVPMYVIDRQVSAQPAQTAPPGTR